MKRNFRFYRLIISILVGSTILNACKNILPDEAGQMEIRDVADTASPFSPLDIFEEYQDSFITDTFDILDKSSQGGSLVKYTSANFPFYVYDLWMYGESGKMNASYFLKEDGEILLVKNTRVDYGRMGMDSLSDAIPETEFLVYNVDSTIKVFSAERALAGVDTEIAYRKAEGAYALLKEMLEAAKARK